MNLTTSLPEHLRRKRNGKTQRNLGASVALECIDSHGIHGLANLTENRIVIEFSDLAAFSQIRQFR